MRVRGNRLARSFGAAGAALTIVLFIEQQWAAHHDFPSFPDLDPSGLFGNPAHPPRRIALLGDSTITAPGLESADDIWIRQLVPDLSDGYRLQIESVAFGGARLSDVVNNQIPELSGSYDLALVSAGSNDALRGMTQLQMRQILTQICEQLLERCEAVVLAGAGDIGTAPRLPFPLSAIATARARATDIAHTAAAEANERIFHIPMWELTTPAYRTQEGLFSDDRFHPNRRGHAIWAGAALPTLRAAFELSSGATR
jgi:lysophospholipase L1-like esterase